MNQKSDINQHIMQEATTDSLLTWIIAGITAVGAYAGLVHAWYVLRFTGHDREIRDLKNDSRDTKESVAEHGERLAANDVHVSNSQKHREEMRDEIQAGLAGIHERLDKVIGRD